MFTRSASLLPLAGVMLAAVPQVLAQCQSYGIDIVNGGAYFINTNSNDSFSSVSQFSGWFPLQSSRYNKHLHCI